MIIGFQLNFYGPNGFIYKENVSLEFDFIFQKCYFFVHSLEQVNPAVMPNIKKLSVNQPIQNQRTEKFI